MRILITAFAISPNRGSEWVAGWQLVTRLAARHSITVLYGDLCAGEPTRREVEIWMAAHPEMPAMELIYVPPGRISILMERLHSKPGMRGVYYTGYRLWHKRALAVARELVKRERFDLVHQITYNTYREPGYMWRLPLPFFWGPMSGANSIPMAYLPVLGARGAVEAVGRAMLNRLTVLTHPRIRSAARRACNIWCVTPQEEAVLRPLGGRTSIMMDTGTIVQDHPRLRSRTADVPLRLVWSGLHVPRKGLVLMLRALAALPPGSNVHVDILGGTPDGGPYTAECKRLAERLGIAAMVTWHGMLPRDRALQLMEHGDALIHTSLLEGAPSVVMESIASGMPVLCHDACGMIFAVTEECGIRVPMTGVEASIRGFAAAIQRLLDDPGLLERLSAGAIRRAPALQWENNVDDFERHYKKALEGEPKLQ